MSTALLLTLGVSKAVWKNLPADRKRKIREQYNKGNKGMAKILLKTAKSVKKSTGKKRKKKA